MRAVTSDPSATSPAIVWPGWRFALPAAFGLALAGCQPTVRIEAPKDPITINLNIKLDADVRLKIEEKAKEDVANKAIF